MKIILILWVLSLSAQLLANDDIELLIVRSQHELLVKKAGHTLHNFKVAFGSGGQKAKLRAGDRMTPKGQYYITKISDSKRFHAFIQLDYPNMNDATRGVKENVISREQYRTILAAHIAGRLPPQNTQLGGQIGIHGIGLETEKKLAIHEMADWTQGCVAMRNHEIDQLTQYIRVGTPVLIVD